MAATAIISRRIGENEPIRASSAAFQVILLGSVFSLLFSIGGFWYAADILLLMGASESIIARGTPYAKIILAGNIIIMLLFIINGAFRGAGNTFVGMRALWLANGINIILDPLPIFGLYQIPGMGLEGAAWATTISRNIAVEHQLYHLIRSQLKIIIRREAIQLNL